MDCDPTKIPRRTNPNPQKQGADPVFDPCWPKHIHHDCSYCLPDGRTQQSVFVAPLISFSRVFAPAIICHLISCFLLVLFYRRCHVWSEIGNSRDINNGRCRCCNGCFCWRLIGRICFQEDPVIGETPFWEQVIMFSDI